MQKEIQLLRQSSYSQKLKLLNCRLWRSISTEFAEGLVVSSRLPWFCWWHGRRCRPTDIICYVLYFSHKWKWLIRTRFVQMRQKPSNIQPVAVLIQLRTLNYFLRKSGTITHCSKQSAIFVLFLVLPGRLETFGWSETVCTRLVEYSFLFPMVEKLSKSIKNCHSYSRE